jgi:predicted phage-related endonuclease
MMRGHLDEPYARQVYADHYAPVDEVGFMTRDFDGHLLGFSPDGLVGQDGLIEIKSRRQKKQLATVLADEVPLENIAQVQCGLLVSGRDWCDFVSYCGGMRLYVKRVHPDPRWHEAILAALHAFEESAAQMIATYTERTKSAPMTERIDHFAEIEIAL